jgi:diguanylate cyclase (GGDEF)-like protein/PAS domain S-box-containing protein
MGVGKKGSEHRQCKQLLDLQASALKVAANAIIITDQEANIVWANAAFEQLTGYATTEVIGQSTRKFKSGQHPPSFYKKLWDTIRSGKHWRGDLINRRKDGSLYWEEMTIAPVRDAAGEIAHFVAIKQDITERRRTEEQSNVLVRAVESSSEYIALGDREYRITYANPALLAATGYAEQELLGRSFDVLLSPNNPAELSHEIAAHSAEGGWRGECLGRDKDGTERCLSLSVSRLKDQQPQTLGTVWISQDITKSKQAEHEILYKTALLEAESEATIDGILAVDEAKRIVLSNRQFAVLWNVPEGMIQARDDTPLLRHVTNQVENPELFRSRVEYLYNHRDEKSRDELRLKDGRFVDRYSAPLVDSAGTYCGRVWYFRDITQSKLAAEKLRVSEEQFREIAENIREVFFVLTPEPPRMTYISPAYDEIWGRPRHELYGRPEAWVESAHPEDRESVDAFYSLCMRGTQAEMEYRVLRPDGTERWIDARGFPVHDPAGKLMRVVGFAEDITARIQREKALAEAHKQLNMALREAEKQACDSARLAELVDILLSCQTVEEAYAVAAKVLPATLSADSGALCMTSASRNMVEAVAMWGRTGTEGAFPPEDCWALRRGKIHRVKDSASPLRCVHVKGLPAHGYLCVPLAAQGETLGMLYLECSSASAAEFGQARAPMDRLERQATNVGERLSLALAHLRLRETLQRQSVRDPLTGLFNRRFMEESLERELGRAIRNKQPVALMMLDIDHFKEFNDTFGHQAGDALLRGLGDFLKQRTRGQDVACRYGGEEFAFILAGATAGAAQKRAVRLREELMQLHVQHAGRLLGSITLSVGVAAFPEHASNTETLLKAADEALYRAKREGRDRVVLA